MATSTVEDYLKAILLHEEPLEHDQMVAMREIGVALAVAPGTVTAMIKTLEKNGLLSYAPYVGVRLTAEGRQVALEVLRRHRLIELFLVEVLDFDWSEVHEEAEQLEHAMSPKVIDRIDTLLGYPRVDPHGDPIPDGQGELRVSESINLVDCLPGEGHRVARISDQDESFLRFIESRGLKPGTEITVVSHDAVADAVTLRPAGRKAVTLGIAAAAKLWVEASSPDSEPRSEPKCQDP
jgi:DtxR family Mn-dependent transcriptional regulator